MHSYHPNTHEAHPYHVEVTAVLRRWHNKVWSVCVHSIKTQSKWNWRMEDADK